MTLTQDLQAAPSRAAIENAALERAAQVVEAHNKEGREWIPGSLWGTLSREAAARIRALKQAAPQQSADPASTLEVVEYECRTGHGTYRRKTLDDVHPDARHAWTPIYRCDTSSKAEAGEAERQATEETDAFDMRHPITYGEAIAAQYERRRAIMEGERNAACVEHFKARPQIDYNGNRRIYEAGFQRGWEAMQGRPAPSEEAQDFTAEAAKGIFSELNACTYRHACRAALSAAQPAPARDDVARMLIRVLEWGNPNGTIENAYLPPWLAQEARSALQGQPAAQVTDPAKDAPELGMSMFASKAELDAAIAASKEASLSQPKEPQS